MADLNEYSFMQTQQPDRKEVNDMYARFAYCGLCPKQEWCGKYFGSTYQSLCDNEFVKYSEFIQVKIVDDPEDQKERFIKEKVWMGGMPDVKEPGFKEATANPEVKK